MTSKIRVYVCIISVVLIIGIGLGVYFSIANSKKEVSITSFDGKITLSLGKHKVGKITADGYYHNVSFSTKNDSLIELIDNSDMVIEKVSYGDKIGESYLLFYEGYYFVVVISRRNEVFVSVQNAYCEVVAMSGFLYVPYVSFFDQVYFTQEFENDDSRRFRAWSGFEFAQNFTELATLYANIRPEYLVGIDLIEKTITLNYFFSDYAAKEIRTDKNLVLKCNNEGVEFIWVDSETNE
jgi:hypothetical protein